MAGGGALLIRAHHGDLMATGRGGESQGLDAIGEDAVVVTDEDPQRGHGMPEGSQGNLSVVAA